MSYPPPHHQEANFENVITTIKTFPLATLISIQNEKPLITHLPLLYESDLGYGKLIGHLDKSNPHTASLKDNKKCTILFHGPDTYISPSIYTTTQLPTWNYIKVHLEGTAKRIDENERIKESIMDLTSFLEGDDPKYVLKKDNPKMEAFINYITGFEIKITKWEGKFKLSQDKNSKDRDNAREALSNNYQPVMKSYLEKTYNKHETKTED